MLQRFVLFQPSFTQRYNKYVRHNKSSSNGCKNYSFVGTCPALRLSNGRINYNRSPNNGKYRTYTRAFHYCNNGYALSSSSGVNSRFCNSAGHWSWGHITCERGNDYFHILIFLLFILQHIFINYLFFC